MNKQDYMNLLSLLDEAIWEENDIRDWAKENGFSGTLDHAKKNIEILNKAFCILSMRETRYTKENRAWSSMSKES